MTTRLEVLDKIGRYLTSEFGPQKVTQRPDGILIVAGDTEAFAIQALTIDAPDGVLPEDFGKELVRHIDAGTSETSQKV